MEVQQTKGRITLYRGQKSKHDEDPFVPGLLRGKIDKKVIDNIEEFIKAKTGITDTDLKSYKSELAKCSFPISCFPVLHQKLAVPDHLYYFFLSLINALLKVQENNVITSSIYSGFFQWFFDTTNKREIEKYTLLSPQDVRHRTESLLKTDAMFDSNSLKVCSFFQHLNFVSPVAYPTLLLDWTSDINVASLFSIGESGEIGTVVSMEYPNDLYYCVDTFSEITFFNAYGYVCTCGTIPDAAGLNSQRTLPHLLFGNLLMETQKATCLYWPYELTLKKLNTEYKEALGFNILSKDEVYEKLFQNKFRNQPAACTTPEKGM
jgi:hypothetical protein